MLRLSGGQVELLFDEALPIEVRELPEDLAGLDRLLSDPAVLAPVEAAWEVAARGHGRPTIPIERFVRLMVVKQRTGWGYETLVWEVSDSLPLRRFCLVALSERVPDESTIRKLCRRLGPDVIEEICRVVIAGRCASGGSRREQRGSTPPWWSLTFATPPTWGWPLTRRGSWRARPPRPTRWPQRTRRGCVTARARPTGGCAR